MRPSANDPAADATRFASHVMDAGALLVVPAGQPRHGPARLFRTWPDAQASVDPEGPQQFVRLYSPRDVVQIVLTAYRRDVAVEWVEHPSAPPVLVVPRIDEETLRGALSQAGWLDPEDGQASLDTDDLEGSDIEQSLAPVAETLLP